MNKIFNTSFNKIFAVTFFLVLLLSFFLRTYKLGINPPSLDWDEASIGYNAYSLLKTGADEYGNKFPLTIRSFDDYKPPVYIYLDTISVGIFGLTELGVRAPSALFGFLTVIVIYFLTKEFFDELSDKKKRIIALFAAFFFGVSPWSLQFSRAAFEGSVGIFFFLLGIFFFLKGLKTHKYLFLSAIFYAISIYSYHSFLLISPIFIFITSIIFLGSIKKAIKYYLLSLVFLFLILIPVFSSFISTNGSGSRLSMVSLFSSPDILQNSISELQYDKNHQDFVGSIFHNRRIVYFLSSAKAYFDQWNPDFLFFHGDGGRQHHAVNMGMLYLWDLPFILYGAYKLFQYKTKKSILVLFIFLIAPFPAAVSTGTPHPVRAIAMAPMFSIFTAIGVFYFLSFIFNFKKSLFYIFATFLAFSFLFNFSYYLHQYYVHTPVEYGDFWQYGNKDAVLYAKSVENNYQKIIFTYYYDQPYVYYLFYNKIDPTWYQKNWDYLKNGQTERMKRIIGKYEFRNINFDKDSRLKNVLLIGSEAEIPQNAKNILKTIYFPNGQVAYRIVSS